LASDVFNKDLRKKIVEMIHHSGEGHIPSAFSIIDIVAHLYRNVLKVDGKNPRWDERDYFVLSKGHGCAALYVMLEERGFITKDDLMKKSKSEGILGGHPDATRVPGAEASTGSLGHGCGLALGLALGLRIREKDNKVIALLGDGESNEGTVWECGLVGANLQLGNLCYIIDNNGSAAQILPVSDMEKKWESFGWEAHSINGHSQKEIEDVFQKIRFEHHAKPKVIIANTLKGKGVSFMEVHGPWHAKVPNAEELKTIYEELS